MRVLDAHAARLHAPDAPRRGAQQEHVAGHALDREILVDRADDGPFGLRDHEIMRGVRNRAAGGDGRQPRAAPAAQPPIARGRGADTRRCARAPCAMPSESMLDHGVEIRARQSRGTARRAAPARTVRPRPTRRRRTPRRSAAPGCRAASRGISRRSSSPARMARTSAAHSTSSSRVVAKSRPLRHRAHPVPGAADALQRHGNRARRSDLADQVHRADVDAQLERSRRHHRAQLAALQARFGVEAQPPREAAVVRQHRLAQPLGQVMRHALGQPPRVDEHQRGAMRGDQLRQPVVDLLPHLVAGHRAQFVARHFHRQIHLAAVADLHDLRARRSENSATSSIGFTVADSPMRCGWRGPPRHQASSRASVSARCEPRLSSATAWISSTMTVRTVRSISRGLSAVSRMYSDSGVVTRMCGRSREHPLAAPTRACRRCAPPCGSRPERMPCAARPAPRSRPAAVPGSSGCRC